MRRVRGGVVAAGPGQIPHVQERPPGVEEEAAQVRDVLLLRARKSEAHAGGFVQTGAGNLLS